jgi:NADH-quinone oxidoreductase subunit M
MIYERRHTRNLDQFGGIAQVMPLFALFLGIAVFSSVGLPGLNGFVGEYLILLGSFEARPWIGAIATSGVVFGAIYLLMMMRKMLFGPLIHAENKRLTDLGAREIVLMVPIVVLVVWIGVAPNVFLSRTTGSIDALVRRIDRARAQTAALASPPVELEVAHDATRASPRRTSRTLERPPSALEPAAVVPAPIASARIAPENAR